MFHMSVCPFLTYSRRSSLQNRVGASPTKWHKRSGIFWNNLLSILPLLRTLSPRLRWYHINDGVNITRPGFVFVQLRGVTALGSSVTRRILREPPFGAATGTAALPSNLASFPSSVRIGAGGVLALALLSSSSRFSSEAASPVGWARHGGGSLQTHRTPSMAIASVPGTGAGGDALVQKGVSSSMMSTEDKLPVIFVLGGPGSGKGTQCEMLAKEYG